MTKIKVTPHDTALIMMAKGHEPKGYMPIICGFIERFNGEISSKFAYFYEQQYGISIMEASMIDFCNIMLEAYKRVVGKEHTYKLLDRLASHRCGDSQNVFEKIFQSIRQEFAWLGDLDKYEFDYSLMDMGEYLERIGRYESKTAY